jgi:UDP:flavonoid glycosyltransferase YjiC (YdhE family)
LTVGRQFDRSTIGPVPANVHVEAWVEQAEVLGQARLVVCHGGSGTAFGAMAAGIPVVVVPLFADQFENGRRIAAAGAGLVVEPEDHGGGGPRRVIAEEDAPRIAHGIEAVLGETSYLSRARRIAVEIARAPTVDDVLGALLTGSLDDIG